MSKEFIGINDIENTPIREGDVVTLNGTFHNYARVVYFRVKYELRMNRDSIAWNLDERRIKENSIKVIGNVYDNKDLLELL